MLVLLRSPLSTTQLVAVTGQGLGSAGRHLRVLLDAELVGVPVVLAEKTTLCRAAAPDLA